MGMILSRSDVKRNDNYEDELSKGKHRNEQTIASAEQEDMDKFTRPRRWPSDVLVVVATQQRGGRSSLLASSPCLRSLRGDTFLEVPKASNGLHF